MRGASYTSISSFLRLIHRRFETNSCLIKNGLAPTSTSMRTSAKTTSKPRSVREPVVSSCRVNYNEDDTTDTSTRCDDSSWQSLSMSSETSPIISFDCPSASSRGSSVPLRNSFFQLVSPIRSRGRGSRMEKNQGKLMPDIGGRPNCVSTAHHSAPSCGGARRQTSELVESAQPPTTSSLELNVNKDATPLSSSRNRHTVKQSPSQSQMFGVPLPQQVHSTESNSLSKDPIMCGPPVTRQRTKQAEVNIDHFVSDSSTSSMVDIDYASPCQLPRRGVSTTSPLKGSRTFSSSLNKSKSATPVARKDPAHVALKELLKDYDMLMIDTNDEQLTEW